MGSIASLAARLSRLEAANMPTNRGVVLILKRDGESEAEATERAGVERGKPVEADEIVWIEFVASPGSIQAPELRAA